MIGLQTLLEEYERLKNFVSEIQFRDLINICFSGLFNLLCRAMGAVNRKALLPRHGIMIF